ncbi:hypothetical protein KP509_31G001900 [Ceratopteris richardii]|uniref:non-specific serine/threonine protein kinase n=1 Tax=Ceratopteris richardii TaxID=49495 RepID=A0A8T2QWA4_CERRI|nr:hypothetical protein KP509_31G001900 [Ceratopteris richardii]
MGMVRGGIHNENTNSVDFPERNSMDRNAPTKENLETEQGSGGVYAALGFLPHLYATLLCCPMKRNAYKKESLSMESHFTDIESRNATSSTLNVSTDNTKAIIFTVAELAKSTSNFSSACKIGEGGFGVVYKGKLKDGTCVAIKRANKDNVGTAQKSQFESEVNLLANVEHLNLVRLIGYSTDKGERILVEEYVANGNLRQHLDGEFKVVLDMSQRLDIAIDVAHALTYLHLYTDQPIIHRDIKSSNILITENFHAKVADFGFSRAGPTESGATHVVTKIKGTFGYLDPEYMKTYKLTTKSDVFAFGILLVELITGRRPIEQSKDLHERITVRWVGLHTERSLWENC